MVQYALACEKAQSSFSSRYINDLATQMTSTQATNQANINSTQDTQDVNQPAQTKRFNGPNRACNYSNNRQQYSTGPNNNMSVSSSFSFPQNSSSSPQNSAQTISVIVNSINVNHGFSKEIVAQTTGTCIMNYRKNQLFMIW